MNKFVVKLLHNLKIHNVKITVYRAQHTRLIQDTTWYHFSSQDNDLWTMKYNYFVVWTFIITESYLPLRTPRKPEEFKVTMCVAVVTHSGVEHPLHSIGNTKIQWSKIVIMHLGQRNNQLWATVMTVSYFRTHPTPCKLIIINITFMNHQSNIIQHIFHTLSITITSSYLVLKL